MLSFVWTVVLIEGKQIFYQFYDHLKDGGSMRKGAVFAQPSDVINLKSITVIFVVFI